MENPWRQRLYHLTLWLVSIIFFMPVVWIIMGAFKTKNDLLSIPPKLIFTPTLDNFTNLFSRHDFLPSLKNSLK